MLSLQSTAVCLVKMAAYVVEVIDANVPVCLKEGIANSRYVDQDALTAVYALSRDNVCVYQVMLDNGVKQVRLSIAVSAILI